MSDRPYNYCPICATRLAGKLVAERERPACPSCGFVNFLDPKVVAVVVIEHEGRLLLGRRNIEPARGKWSFCSGYVNRGERVESAALREVKEETNLDALLEGLLGVYSSEGDPHVLLAYRARVTSDLAVMQAQGDEVMELRFFAPAEAPELAFPGDERILRDWLDWRARDAGIRDR